MADRSRRLSEPLHWGRREKVAIGALLACLALAVISLGVYAVRGGAPKGGRCVEVTFASTLGGARIHACNDKARVLCAAPNPGRGIAQALRAECRRAGFPVARSG